MKKSMKLVALVLVVALAMFTFAACSTTQPGTAESASESAVAATSAAETAAAATAAEAAVDTANLKFAISLPTLDNPYFVQVQSGFEAKCKELGVEVVANACDYDSAKQFSQFENYIEMGVNGIASCPVDQVSLQEITAQAQAAGIKVVGEAQAIDNADGNVIVDDYGYGVINGENAAKWINEKLDGKAKVALITLDFVEAVKLRGDGMADTITKLCPDSEIVARQPAETMEEAMAAVETILQANPDVKVIACVNDQMAIGAAEAVANMGLATDDFYVGGADNTDEVLSKMADPASVIRVTTDIGPVKAGEDCAQMLYDMIVNGTAGETVYFEFTPNWQADLAA